VGAGVHGVFVFVFFFCLNILQWYDVKELLELLALK